VTLLAGIDSQEEKEGEDQMTQQTFNVSEDVRVEVRDCRDRVTVIGWDDKEHVSVDYAARQEGEAIVVEGADKVMVHVPHSAPVKIAECEADVRVEHLDGRVELESIGGVVSLCSLRGEVFARDIEGGLAARDVASIKGEGSWDGDVSLYNVMSFDVEQVGGAATLNQVEAATLAKVEGDFVAKGVKSLKGAGEWEGDVTLREVESVELKEIDGSVSMSELSAVKIVRIDGDLNAYNVRGSFELSEVNGDVNLRDVSGSVSLDRVEGDFIASDVRGALRVLDIEGDAIVSMGEVTQTELHADGDVVINLPVDGNAEIDLDAPRGHLVAHADIQIDHEDENHLSGKLGGGGVKIRAESARGDLILRAGGTERHHIHASFRHEAFANMGQEIAQQVRDSMRESLKGWRVNVRPKIRFKHRMRWGKRHGAEEDREVINQSGPAAGSRERQEILDAIARGEMNVDDAIKKLRGE
jgi:DUF4097 and DUF4098 domain-containing protein YvlB